MNIQVSGILVTDNSETVLFLLIFILVWCFKIVCQRWNISNLKVDFNYNCIIIKFRHLINCHETSNFPVFVHVHIYQ